jgi:transcriptional regulator with GAF, ATPase, and Fis domain
VNFGIRGHKTGMNELTHDADDIKALCHISDRWQRNVRELSKTDAELINRVIKKDNIALADMARFMGKDPSTLKLFLRKWDDNMSGVGSSACCLPPR